MKMASGSLLVCLVAAILPSARSAAQAPLVDGAAKVDRYGDPLPAGAVLRLGTVRLRHSGEVQGVAFSRDGKYVVSSGADPIIRFWDVTTGAPGMQLKTARGDERWIRTLDFSPDGAKLASGDSHGTVRLWDTATGKLLYELFAPTSASGRPENETIWEARFSPDGLILASTSTSNAIHLWDVASGAYLLKLLKDRGGSNHTVAFSPDGGMLAIGKTGGDIEVRDLAHASAPRTFASGHIHAVSLAFTRDGKHLISTGPTPGLRSTVSKIILWDSASLKQVAMLSDEEKSGGRVVVSDDGKLLVASHVEKIDVWDLATRRPVQTIRRENGGMPVSISPDNRLVASVGRGPRENEVGIWDIKSGERILSPPPGHGTGVTTVAASRDGKLIATASVDSEVRLWNAVTGEHIRQVDSGTGNVRYLEFTPDAKSLVIARETRVRGRKPELQGEIKLCQVDDAKVVNSHELSERVVGGAMAPDGRQLALLVGVDSGELGNERPVKCKIFVWDAELGAQVAESSGEGWRFTQIAFSDDGEEITAIDTDAKAISWNWRSGKTTRDAYFGRKSGDPNHIASMLFPGAMRLAVSDTTEIGGRSYRDRVLVRDPTNQIPIWESELPDLRVACLAVSPDGKQLAAILNPLDGSAARQRIVIWAAESGRELRSIVLADVVARAIAFSADSSKLVSGMAAGDALIWDVQAAPAK